MPVMFVHLEVDQPYAPQQPDEGNGIVEFFTSAQTILGIVAALIALALLLSSLWPGRRQARDEEGEEREEKS
ncbi:hypothetical protein [Streptomyces sp. UG1]|uniref:hypothetical protein n=1 Tax=Streptomyces sp. UG1 TaxID=3417652 RepID=UPI003CF9DF89